MFAVCVSRFPRRCFSSLVLAFGLLGPAAAAACAQAPQDPPRILVYTRNYTPVGTEYVHENIADSVRALQRIGAQHHLLVDATDDPSVFTDANLARYAVLVFANTNNEALDTEPERAAFQHYIHAGHGFVGLHSAAGTERNWPYFQQVLGARFAFHPKQQTFTVTVADPAFSVMQGVPATFTWNDECYFMDRRNPDVHVVLTTDRTKLQLGDKAAQAEAFPNPLPLAWYNTFDNSREFYLALGHDPASYSNPLIYGIIERAILWTLHRSPGPGTFAR